MFWLVNYWGGVINDYRLNFHPGKKNEVYYYSWKEHLSTSKTAKFGREMLKNVENVVLRSLQILYIFVLRENVLTTFPWKIVIFFRA